MKLFARLMASFIFIWVAVRPSGAAAGTVGASQLDCASAGHAAPTRKTRDIPNRKCIVPSTYSKRRPACFRTQGFYRKAGRLEMRLQGHHHAHGRLELILVRAEGNAGPRAAFADHSHGPA